MKRRSARPFTVEIKHTRTSRVSLSESPARSPTSQTLWHDVPLVLSEAPLAKASAPVIRAEPTMPEAPARRILPSLVPMFAPQSEPEVQEAPAEERLARVRRPKPSPVRRPKAADVEISVEADTVQAANTASKIAIKTASTAGASPAGPVVEALAPVPRTTRLSRKLTALAPGQRWKRRLPRVLW
jgi:hypothetical protein